MFCIYPAIIHDDNDGFWAEFPDLEGCTSQGESLEEILCNAKEAMELYVLGLLEDGIKLPVASKIKNLKNLDEDAFSTLIETNIDLAKNTKSVKKTLTIPAWLNDRALEKGINFSQVLQEALIAKTI